MEHILTFAINLDDDTIRKHVQERAEKEVIESIKHDIEAYIFETNFYGKIDKNSVQQWIRDVIRNVVEDNKEIIVNTAVGELTKNMMKSKIVREAIAKAVE